MRIVETKLFIGGVSSGKTNKCIEHAAQALRAGKSVLFINDEERTEFLMGRIGERLFTLNTYAMKKLPAIKLAVTSYTNEHYFTGHRFDVVIVDTIKKVVDDFHNNKGHFSKPKKDRKISPDVKNLLEKSSFEDKVAIIMDILDSDLSTPVQQDILLKYKDLLLEIKKINKEYRK